MRRAATVQVLWLKMQHQAWNWMLAPDGPKQPDPCPSGHYAVLGVASSAVGDDAYSVVGYFPEREDFQDAISSNLRSDMESVLDELVGPHRLSERLVGACSVSERFVRRALVPSSREFPRPRGKRDLHQAGSCQPAPLKRPCS